MIKVNVFLSKRKLKKAFKSASGTLTKKSIGLIVFSSKNGRIPYEMPLSPSLGYSVLEVCEHIKKQKQQAFKSHPILTIALSYAQNILFRPFKDILPFFNDSKKVKMITYGLGEIPVHDANSITRLKVSTSSQPFLSEFSQTHAAPWCVDFNASLTPNDFYKYFKDTVVWKNCLWVEQPYSKDIDLSAYMGFPIPVILDEGILSIKPKNLLFKSAVRGLVLKYLRHSFEKMVKWCKFAQEKRLLTFVSSPVADIFSYALNSLWNQCTTIHNVGYNQFPQLLEGIPAVYFDVLEEKNGFLTLSDEAQTYIDTFYKPFLDEPIIIA